ncbi:MAG TPA: hypothetical protein PKV27_01635 [Ilumatobacteraceae bacterium]|nr:hypothetical protein [Ilumatobacteraceae bacterium]
MNLATPLRLIAAGVFTVAAPAVALAGCGDSSGDAVATEQTFPEQADFQWVIPLGTADKVALGTHDKIFPAVLYVKVGQSIRIVNEDTIPYTVGPFSIGAKQTLEQVMRSPGTFEGECTTHKGARFLMIVEE